MSIFKQFSKKGKGTKLINLELMALIRKLNMKRIDYTMSRLLDIKKAEMIMNDILILYSINNKKLTKEDKDLIQEISDRWGV